MNTPQISVSNIDAIETKKNKYELAAGQSWELTEKSIRIIGVDGLLLRSFRLTSIVLVYVGDTAIFQPKITK